MTAMIAVMVALLMTGLSLLTEPPAAAAGGSWRCTVPEGDSCTVSGGASSYTLTWTTHLYQPDCTAPNTPPSCVRQMALNLNPSAPHHFVTSASCTDGTLLETQVGGTVMLWRDPVPRSVTCTIVGDQSYVQPGDPNGFEWQQKTNYGQGEIHQVDGYYDDSVPPAPPTVDFTANAVGSPLKYQFVASATPQGGATITGYDWEFGDGSTGNGQTPTHTFAKPGTYHVTVRVTDSNGQQRTVGRDLVVSGALVVNSTADTANGASAGSACDTGATVGTPAVPECTLRAAIQAANANANANGGAGGKAQEITFAIPDAAGTPTISPATSLPTATAPVSIDATTQAGGRVRLAGPSSISGLSVSASDSTVRGFLFEGFDYAVKVGSNTETKSNDTVTDNRFGTDGAGTTTTSRPATAVLAAHAAKLTISDNVMSTSGTAVQLINDSNGTVSGNRIGVDAAGSAAVNPAQSTGLLLRGGGPYTVKDNTIATTTVGILLRGGGASGSAVTDNHIGVNAAGTARITSTGVGVFVDGVPGVEVTDNVVATGAGGDTTLSAEIVVTGAQQCGTSSGCLGPFLAQSGTVTGGKVTVRGNRVGVLANGSAAGSDGKFGILCYGRLPGAIIESNVVGGHFDPSTSRGEIALLGTVDAIVSSNTIGTNAAGTVALASRIGVDVEGAAGTTVQNNLISGNDTAGVRVGEYPLTGAGTPAQSSKTVVKDNVIGLNRAGTAAVGNRVGVLVTDQSATTDVGPKNIISGNERAGVAIDGKTTETEVLYDAIGTNRAGVRAIPNRVGVDVSGDASGVAIYNSVIAGNSGAGVATTSPKVVHLSGSFLGRHDRGVVVANAVGVDAHGPMDLINDRVWGNSGAGVTSADPEQVAIFSSTTFSDNGTVGIVAPGRPAAPTLEAVLTRTSSGKPRLQFVATDPSDPHALIGVAIYANPDCSQPGQAKAKVSLAKAKYVSSDVRVLSPASTTTIAGGYTATVTEYGALSSDITKPVGRTSPISTCVRPHAYPDTSGTGVEIDY